MAGPTQMDFLNGVPPPAVDRSVDRAERPRLNRQSLEVLARLREGPASNGELAAITHRFSARFYDLRKAGYKIECVEKDAATGLRVYALADRC